MQPFRSSMIVSSGSLRYGVVWYIRILGNSRAERRGRGTGTGSLRGCAEPCSRRSAVRVQG